MRIRYKLLLFVGAPALVFSTAALVVDYFALRSREYERMENLLSAMADRCADRLDGRLETLAQIARSEAGFIGGYPLLREPHLYQLLTTAVQLDPLVYGACIAFEPNAYEPGRRLMAPYVHRTATQTETASLDIAGAYDYTSAEWKWYAEPKSRGTGGWTDPYFDEGAGNVLMVTYSEPIRVNGAFQGVATVDVRLDDFQQRFALPELEGARWFILSRSGRFVSAADLSVIRDESAFDIMTASGRSDVIPVIQAMVDGHRGSARIRGLIDGLPSLVFHTPIRSTGWTFGASVSEAKVMEPVYQHLRERFVALMASSVVVLLAVLVMGLRIVRPIRPLSAAVAELAGGNLDARVVGVNSGDELGELAGSFNAMVTRLKRSIAERDTARAEQAKVESELLVAREIQLSLLPRAIPPFPNRTEFDLHALNASALQVAGDFFDFMFIDEHHMLAVIADVSGKGVPAALLMAVCRTLVRVFASPVASAAEVMREANRRIADDNDRAMFVTVVLFIYDVRTGQVRMVNAGHPPPFRMATDGGVTECPAIGGIVLGVDPDATYEESEFTLGPGESLVLYTDGVSEAMTPAGALFGEERIAALLPRMAGASAADVCAGVLAEIDAYQQGVRNDDVTLMVLRRMN